MCTRSAGGKAKGHSQKNFQGSLSLLPIFFPKNIVMSSAMIVSAAEAAEAAEAERSEGADETGELGHCAGSSEWANAKAELVTAVWANAAIRDARARMEAATDRLVKAEVYRDPQEAEGAGDDEGQPGEAQVH